MAWIEGAHTESFVVDQPIDVVAAFFCDPAEFQRAFTQLASCEEVEENVWRWVLQPQSEAGVKFQADYTVEYTRDGNTVTWSTRDGGTLRSHGRTVLTDLGGGQTEVDYQETIATDLPIPRLAAKVFRPIVAREIAKGVGEFLTVSRELLAR